MKLTSLPSLIVALLVSLWALTAQALPEASAETDHAKVMITSEALAITPGEPFHVAIDFELEEHWHIYWKNPGDSGLAPEVEWELPSGFAVGSVQWPTPKRIEMSGLTNYGYEGSPSLIQKMIPPYELEGLELSQGGNEIILRAELDWLICKEICIPESAELALTLPISDSPLLNESFASRLKALPQTPKETDSFAYAYNKEALVIESPLPLSPGAYFYPETAGIIDHAAPHQWVQEGEQSYLVIPRGLQPIEREISGVLVSGGSAYNIAPEESPALQNRMNELMSAPPAGAGSELSLVFAILFALLGGLLLNAMPCVFPVLSLKALAISQKAEKEPKEVRKQGIAYLFGVLLSFLALGGAMLALKQAGQSIGWGFQLQSPLFVTAMLVLFFLLGLSLIGMFHLPVLFGAKAQQAEQKQSSKGSFLTGILAVLVATPCAVPFMAPAVGYAFAQPMVITLLIMLMLGIGLALPYVLLAFIPAFHRLLPKPGAWMNTFKEFMAFPMFASAAWLLWVLSQQVSMEVQALVLTLLVLTPFLLWLRRGWAVGLLVLSLIGSLWLVRDMTDTAYIDAYKELSEPFTPARLAELQAEGKPVFVNATAAWCITCKVNERVALRDERIAQAFQDKGITYLIADWTNYDDTITQWLERYQRSGVPLYVYYPAGKRDGIVLPQLLTPSTVLDIINKEDSQ